MTDPYKLLGETLTAAAHRQETHDHRTWRVRSWLSHRLNAAVMAVVLVLAGGAIAVAATGLLSGSPVKEPEGAPTPNSGLSMSVSRCRPAIGMAVHARATGYSAKALSRWTLKPASVAGIFRRYITASRTATSPALPVSRG